MGHPQWVVGEYDYGLSRSHRRDGSIRVDEVASCFNYVH
jgi:hypothetical protein